MIDSTLLSSRRSFLAQTCGTFAALSVTPTLFGAEQSSRVAALSIPALPFAETALEPTISARTLQFHYGKHHQGYVTTLNKLLPATPFANDALHDIVRKSWKQPQFTAVFNNAAQIWNHTFYWNSLTPTASQQKPSGKIEQALIQSFGSLQKFEAAFLDAALTQFGSGWAWLVAEGDKLAVIKTPNAETPLTTPNLRPLLVIDVWEHAYYLDYQNRRADYVKAIISQHLNWAFATKNLVACC